MLLLSKSDIDGIISMEDVIKAVETAFLAHAKGKTVYPPKTQFMLPTKEWRWWGFMPAYVEGMGLACKITSEYPEKKAKGLPALSSTIILCDSETGEVKALMDGKNLTAIRTGALCALGADRLARKDASTASIIGCGIQARKQLEGLTKVRKLKKVKVYDVTEAAMDAFISDMKKLGVPMEKSTAEGVLDSDIIVAATVSSKPVVLGSKIKPGTHVTSIGAHTPDAREVDEEFVRKAKVVVADSRDALKSGDLKDYKGQMVEIQEVLAGKKIRTSESDVTFFKSVGTALQDVAIAALVYEKAKRAGLGKEVAL